MASLSSSFGGLSYEALTGVQRDDLKREKANALLEQQSNIENYKKKLASYRTKMASQGASGLFSGVQDGLKEEAQKANASIAQKMNQKIKDYRNTMRRKTLLSLGFSVGSA
jgi:hypothetical protein